MTAEAVLKTLEGKGWTLALAESLTGGALADAFVRVPGASKVLRGSVVAYATDLKAELLGVDADLLAARGAVDAEVASQMAVGAAARLNADVAVATTGVAGPDEQDGKPVGTVFVAVSIAGEVSVFEYLFSGDRAQVRASAVEAAISSLESALSHR